MSDQKEFLSLKMTFFYNFFPSKEEEEACKLNNTPYIIKIKITSYEVEAGALLIPYIKTFEYILRYWTLDLAKILVNGCGVCVQVWDKYEGEGAYLWKLCNDDYALSCIELFNSSRLGVGDEIGLFWDPRSSNFMFKLLSKENDPKKYESAIHDASASFRKLHNDRELGVANEIGILGFKRLCSKSSSSMIKKSKFQNRGI
ncbi:hypothetical protein H5410_028617 [Solanum commersonii]|uniref:B3 domain-containing protein n=1 Tax=Solanum commersonii TaxID=4109 RepID=A0A9J5Z4I0_SOLCO|nr:hypothetical protein H5410_028617 [Solanum commersonii]